MQFNPNPRIAVIGLGYVGLPLATQLAKHFTITGFDINAERVKELQSGDDKTGEVAQADLKNPSLILTQEKTLLENHDVYIVTVPTPIDEQNQPDLTAVKKAAAMVGENIKQGAIVVFESTVYPGVTEDICGPILTQQSGLKIGQELFLGYSPERINPGDKKHTLNSITKVVAGQTPEVSKYLRTIYGKLNQDNIFEAASIKVAEAAKVIENTQRDINIAFINELTKIFHSHDLSVYDVLEAAKTKWNFLDFTPGLVGGHCIGVDPYYLANYAQTKGFNPDILLSGRQTNESMGAFFAKAIIGRCQAKQNKILLLGITFKENIPDLRNSKVIDMINYFREQDQNLVIHDPHADPREAKQWYGIDLTNDIYQGQQFDAIVIAVQHSLYQQFTTQDFSQLLKPNGLLADLKGIYRKQKLPENVRYWTL